jgi:spore maturation protein CgeB
VRIFYASDTTPNSSFQSNLWRNNLYQPLVDLGHDVVEFQYDLRETFQNLDPTNPEHKSFIRKNRPKVTSELLRQIKVSHAEKPIDLFFSYFYDACVMPEAIDEIKSMGIKTVNWYCNGSYQLHLVSEISPHYDWCLVPEKFRIKDYLAMGANPIYCQEAANPNIYKPYDLPVEFDVTFVGQAYGERPALIQYLLNNGIDVRVWGWGWKNHHSEVKTKSAYLLSRTTQIGKKLMTSAGWQLVGNEVKNKILKGINKDKCSSKVSLPVSILGGVLSDNEMIQIYSCSKINLGFSTCGNTHESESRILQVRLRDFEVPMSGGFYMVEYMEELEEFFEIGDEIVCYTDKEDLVAKIKYYLEHDEEREKIRQAGYKRCLRDHTWHKRFEMAFREMKVI